MKLMRIVRQLERDAQWLRFGEAVFYGLAAAAVVLLVLQP